MLARGRGQGVTALVNSLHSRLATSLDAADILQIAQNGYGVYSPATGRGDRDGNGRDRGGDAVTVSAELQSARSRSGVCPALVLMGVCDGVLDVIGECDAGGRGRDGTAGVLRTVGDACSADAHGALLRSALKSFLELAVGREVASFAASEESGKKTGRSDDRAFQGGFARDDMLLQPEDSHAGHKDKPGGLPPEAAVDPIRQLVTLNFFLQGVRRWPRLAVKFMREVGAWNVFFSDHFLTGRSCLVLRVIASLEETPDDVDTVFGDYGGSRVVDDDAVGWGLVRDATLLLLETVAVVRGVLQVEPPVTESVSDERRQGRTQEQDEWCAMGTEAVGCGGQFEVEEYVRVLMRGESSQPSPLTAVQGCRWLRAMVAAERAMGGGGVFLPSALRVAIVRLAFQLCDRGNGVGLGTQVSGTAAWPLMHASLSVVVDLVGLDGVDESALLFRAAVGSALGADVTSTTAKSHAHRPTASLTSEASTPRNHATGVWRMPGSGGSRTPASASSLSPSVDPGVSFGDTSIPTPQLPRPVPEVLFKAALDPRVRRAVFYLTTKLGLEAGREILASPEVDATCVSGIGIGVECGHGSGATIGCDAGESWALREIATEVLSGLVEGYLCLCERAAAVTAAGLAATDDGPGLLLDALHGACALIRTGAPTGGDGAAGGDRDRGEARGARLGAAAGRVTQRDSGVSPLLQEAFREHWASARLLVVLEGVVVVAGLTSSGWTSSNAPTATTESCANVVSTSLSFFTALMAGNSLGKSAFQRALAEHAGEKAVSLPLAPSARPGDALGAGIALDGGSFAALADLVSIVPAAKLSRALVEMLMDGDVPACILEITEAGRRRDIDDVGGTELGGRSGEEENAAAAAARERGMPSVKPPEIRNPLVVPLIFRLLPDWPTSEQGRTLHAFRFLLRGAGGGVVNRSVCCDVQPALMDQVRRRAFDIDSI